MFGSIVSCTDPIAVVAVLKELGVPKKYYYKLDSILSSKERV
jgi:NhaP-type Na+/H+ or K+/H+ antiporter